MGAVKTGHLLEILSGTIDDREIKVEYLSERIKGSPENRVGSDETPTTLQEATVRLERKMVVEALRQTARIPGLTRQGLLNKITRYEI